MEHPAKNHVRLIRAFAKLKERSGCPHRLVLAGRRWPGDQAIHEEARRWGSDVVIMAGAVQEGHLLSLTCGAEAVVFPSLFEGFGLPVLEAMACGVPVACSRAASLPEIAPDEACTFDPLDEDDIARAIETLIVNPAAREICRIRGLQRAKDFDWKRTAQQTLDVLREQAGQSAGVRHRPSAG
jgi:glycosyltransferase involved in cell wall biosynthesis